MKYQEQGWYFEGTGAEYPLFFKLKPDDGEPYVSSFLAHRDLISMPTRSP